MRKSRVRCGEAVEFCASDLAMRAISRASEVVGSALGLLVGGAVSMLDGLVGLSFVVISVGGGV